MINEKIARLPVVDHGNLIGLISDNEIAFAFAEVKKSITLGHQKHYLDELLVSNVMKTPAIWTNPNMTASEAEHYQFLKTIK